MDHAYILITQANPPDILCRAFAFVLQEFSLAQFIIVLYTAVSACALVVFQVGIKLGGRDWLLLVAAFGVPLMIGAFCIWQKYLGPTGAWYEY